LHFLQYHHTLALSCSLRANTLVIQDQLGSEKLTSDIAGYES